MTRLERDITIHAPPDAVYELWRRVERFPEYMHHVEDVRDLGHGTSSWRVRGPLGRHIRWQARMTIDEPGRAIGWSCAQRGIVSTAGRIDFLGEGAVTRLHVTLQYEPRGGPAGEMLARLLANPDRRIDDDLHHFKHVAEKLWHEAGDHSGELLGDVGRANQVKGRTTAWGHEPADFPVGPGMPDPAHNGREDGTADDRSIRGTRTGSGDGGGVNP